MDEPLLKAEKADELWGEGELTGGELIGFLDPDDLHVGGTANRAWWKSVTEGYLAIRRGRNTLGTSRP